MNVMHRRSQHFSGTRSNSAAGAAGPTNLARGGYSDAEGLGAGHVVVRAPSMAVGDDEDWVTGYPGVTAQQRITRAANQSNIDVAAIAPSTNETASNISGAMGPQSGTRRATPCTRPRPPGWRCSTTAWPPPHLRLSARARQVAATAAALTLNAASGHLMPPFDPIDDDQVLFNHYTVARHGGNQGVEYLDVTGFEGAHRRRPLQQPESTRTPTTTWSDMPRGASTSAR